MRTTVIHLFLASIGVLSTSCVPEMKAPLSDPAVSQQDSRLYGVWISESQDDDMIEYLHIGDASFDPLDANAEEPSPGWMQAVSVTYYRDIHMLARPSENAFIPIQLGDTWYASVVDQFLQDEEEAPFEFHGEKSAPIVYTFLRYGVTDDRLEVSLPELETMAKVIKKGFLRGDVKYEGGHVSRVVITDTQENVRRFLASNEAAALFPKELTVSYRRLK